MYINTQTNQVASEQEIKLANPNTSFSVPFNPPEEYKWVFPTPQPIYNPVTQSVRSIAPELTGLGHYEQRWGVVNIFDTPEDEAAAIVADTVAKYKASVPEKITPRQIRQALTLTSIELRAKTEAAVAASDQDTKDWWEFATMFERLHPKVVSMAQLLGKSEEEVDAIFILGATL